METTFITNFLATGLNKVLFSKENRVRISPITLIGLILVFSVILTIGDKKIYIACAVTGMICLSLFSIKETGKFIIFFSLIKFLMWFLEGRLGGVLVGSIYMMLGISFQYAPVFLVARIISLYSSSYLISVLRNSGIKGNIAVAVALFFRFIPEIKIRLAEIKDGLKIRGFQINILHPVKAFELYFVPLLYKCLAISDTLTCSIMMKGMEYDGEKTSFHDLTYSKTDYILWVVSLMLLGVSLWRVF